MPGKPHIHTPKFRRCVEELQGKGYTDDSAYAICTASFQKAGEEFLAQANALRLREPAIGKPLKRYFLSTPILLAPRDEATAHQKAWATRGRKAVGKPGKPAPVVHRPHVDQPDDPRLDPRMYKTEADYKKFINSPEGTAATMSPAALVNEMQRTQAAVTDPNEAAKQGKTQQQAKQWADVLKREHDHRNQGGRVHIADHHEVAGNKVKVKNRGPLNNLFKRLGGQVHEVGDKYSHVSFPSKPAADEYARSAKANGAMIDKIDHHGNLTPYH